MSRLTHFLRKLSVAALLAITVVPAYADAPRRELRSAWVTTAWAIDWPQNKTSEATQKAEAITILDNLKAMGANCVYFHVRSMNDRYYNQTAYTYNGNSHTVYGESRSKYLAGSYDALQYWLDEAHKRGMELYAWINPYRAASSQSDYNSQYLPDDMQSWVMKSKTTDSDNNIIDIWVYNPALDETKNRIRDVCVVLAGNYDLDGIVFDDYFYPSRISVDDANGASPDQTQYNAYIYGGGKLGLADWRRKNINDMVSMVNAEIHKVKPWVKFGISPAGVAYKGLDNFSDEAATERPTAYGVTTNDWQYDEIYSDPIHWVHERTIDFISPQIYWQYNGEPPFKGCCEWWTRYAKKHDVHFYASHSVSYIYFNSAYNGQAGYDLEKLKIDCVRKEGTENDAPFGSVYYSMRGLGDGVRALMADGVYRYKALTPEFTTHGSGDPRGTDPGYVDKLKTVMSGSNVISLTWTAKAALSASLGDGAGVMRYSVYAIPSTVLPTETLDTDGGIQAQYLLGTSYSASMDIPADKRSGYYYVVCCLDRYGHEWAPSYCGDMPTPPTPLEKPELITPADGVRITANTRFAVEDVMGGYPGERTVIQISRNADFSDVILEYNGTEADVRFLDISYPGTYYWRARVDRGGVESVYSDVRSFQVIAEPLEQPVLFKPDDGANISEATNFVASYVTDDPSMTELQIFDNADCEGTPVLTSTEWGEVADANNKIWLQHLVNPFDLGNGTYWWRVNCTRTGVDDVNSETRSFTIGNGVPEQGYLSEDGYEPKKDLTTQATVNLAAGKVADLQSLWIRKRDINPFSPVADADAIRDICVRPADTDQARDIVYLSSKTGRLVRLDARTGENIGDITLKFDSQWTGYTYLINGVCVDSKNRMYVHSLAVGGKQFLVGVVTDLDEANRTATVKTLLSYTASDYRFDHARVYGDLMTGTGYIMAITRGTGDNNTIYSWVVNNGTVGVGNSYWFFDNIGAASYVYPLSAERMLVKASSGSKCKIVNVPDYTVEATSTLGSEKSGGVTAFRHGGRWFMVIPARDYDSGMAWAICSVNDLGKNFAGESIVSEMPAGDYMGKVQQSSGDYGAPVVYMQTGHGQTSATGVDDPTTTYIYGLCNQNGVAAYQLTTHITTGTESIVADGDESAAEYYNLQGVRMPAAATLAPGIYIRRTPTTSTKVVIR